MNCKNCGVLNDVNSKNCINCGSALEISTSNMGQTDMIEDVSINNQNQAVSSSLVQPITNENQVQSDIVNPAANYSLNQSQVINTTDQPMEPLHQKKKINSKVFIIIAIVLIIIILGIIFILKPFNKDVQTDVEEPIVNTDSFWIKNSEDLYALFDVDGNQLTDFEFSYVDYEFVNGTMVVRNKEDEYGVISSLGKMVIDFGKYEEITNQFAIYVAIDKDSNSFLYEKSGKFIRKINGETEYGVEGFNEIYTYALIQTEKNYKVIDNKGNEVATIPVSKNDEDASVIDGSGKEKYASVFYNDINYIIDISKRKTLLTIADSKQLCIHAVNKENNDEFILATCNNENIETNKEFKLIRNGKIAYSKETKEEYTSMEFEGNSVVFSDADNTYVLDENGNKKINATDGSIYKDYKNYIIKSKGNNGAELYVNDKLKEKINCNDIEGGYSKHGIYLLNECNGYDSLYINFDGTKLNNKKYEVEYNFDENGYATVSEDGEKYYLIDTKGEKVSDYYYDFSSLSPISRVGESKKLYYAINNDETKTVFEVKENKILTGKIEFLMTYGKVDSEYVIVENENKYEIYSLIEGKTVITLNTKPDMTPNYFTVNENSKTKYYSYTTGKLFYEE